MGRWNYRDEGKKISKSVLKEKTTPHLKYMHKFLKKLLELR